MALEAATYISQLVASNPTGADKKSQGDDQIRLLKAVLQATFPTGSRAFNLAEWAEKNAAGIIETGNRTMVATDNGKAIYFDCTASSRTYDLLDVASAPAGTIVFLTRDKATTANTLTISASGAELVNDAASVIVRAGESGLLYKLNALGNEWAFLYTRTRQDWLFALSVVLAAAGDAAVFESTLASAARAPDVVAYRNRNGVNNDFVGSFVLRGKNTAGTVKDMARLRGKWIDVVAASEDAYGILSALKNNVETDEATIGDGITLGAATGGQPGTGKMNATGYKLNGADFLDSFGTKLLHLRDEKVAGTAGGSFTSGAWRTHDLTTEMVDEIGSTLSSNQFTLPAGTYFCEGHAIAYACAGHKLRLRNITDGTTAIVGSHADNSTGGISIPAVISGRFTIAGAKTFELQHRCQTTRNTDGFGQAMNFGEVEVFSDLKVWKIA